MRALLVTVAWPTDRHPLSGIFVKEQVSAVRRLGVEVDVFHFAAGRNPLSYVRARRGIGKRLAERTYDVVHAHFGQTGFAVPRNRPPFVVTFHGSDLEGIVARWGGYAPRSLVLRRMSRITARRADHAILQSSRQVALLPDRLEYVIAPMGLDLEVFRPVPQASARAALGLDPNRRLILFSGDPAVPVKRFALARQAIDALGREDVELITLTGRPRDAVSRAMSASDALVITSRHESGPLMAKEAVACGLPVVSLDVGDVGDWMPAVDGCEIVSEATPEAIARALARVLGRGGRVEGRSVVSAFAADETARKVVSVYERAIRAFAC